LLLIFALGNGSISWAPQGGVDGAGSRGYLLFLGHSHCTRRKMIDESRRRLATVYICTY